VEFRVERVDYKTAKQFVETWHYSGCIPKGRNVCFGLFADNALYAVIVYGNGVNPYQASFLGVERVVEIKRMCRIEPRLEEYPLTKFIALTSKLLMVDYPYDCIVAFADPEHGHEGTVYKAANFWKHGVTQAEWHVVDASGEVKHRRVAYRHARRNGLTIAESRDVLGLTRVKTLPKIRWVRYFGKFKRLNNHATVVHEL